jgi:DMSO/TMAO reductase YedYZ heme-binding membrane subunit
MSIPFLDRQKVALSSASLSNPFWYWVNTAVFGFSLFGVILAYFWWESGELAVFGINQAAADAGTILISLSMFLTVLSYFFDRFDKKIIYRKHLGIIGFAYVVAHIVFVVLLMPTRYPLTGWLTTRILPFTFGAIATAIFALMTLISNRYAASSMGGVVWRGILRYGGYGALVMSLVHIWLATSRFWSITSPSLSMLVFVFGALTVVARVVMKLALLIKR